MKQIMAFFWYAKRLFTKRQMADKVCTIDLLVVLVTILVVHYLQLVSEQLVGY